MQIYQDNIHNLKKQQRLLKRRNNQYSFLRGVTFLTAIPGVVLMVMDNQYTWLSFILLALAVFSWIVHKHRKLKFDKKLVSEKIKVNQHELSHLQGQKGIYDSGKIHSDPIHPFSFDLDIFGDNSLFEFLNRTGTYQGSSKLAAALKTILPENEIIDTQQSLKELSGKIQWRIEFYSLSRLFPDSKKSYDKLIEWSKLNIGGQSKLIRLSSFITPVILFALIIIYLFTSIAILKSFTGLIFFCQLGLLGFQTKRIVAELKFTTIIEKILKKYAYLLASIEKEDVHHEGLQDLKSNLFTAKTSASRAVSKLSLLFDRMEHVTNIFASPLLNGLFLYHIHIIRRLENWRFTYGSQLEKWINTIAEFEKLNSLANFSYNHPNAIYPEMNDKMEICFTDLVHPLIKPENSVANSINFKYHRLLIITGSNMSGKSTFLRMLGVNMLLSGIGAPVCAKRASVHPLPIIVSMRMSDSLSSGESYFYVEVKRLKFIMDQLGKGSCFVLLDEILRGTNSDDKRNGTLEVIKKLVQLPAYGAIATHDLEVCKIADKNPEIISNKRFEVQIVDNELRFDYKLLDGICQNKSASYIMKKIGVL